jgi:hypothetical protein
VVDYHDEWNEWSFSWAGTPNFPSNYIIREVFVNIWGRLYGSNCCEYHYPFDGCTDDTCESLVCAMVPECCTVGWGETCVDLAIGEELCLLNCSTNTIEGGLYLDEVLIDFIDGDSDGYGWDVDCDDEDPSINPGHPEVCDGLDNDCDPATADGSDELWLGEPCDGPDSDLCEEGGWECTAGQQTCSDDSGDNVEICDNLDNDCDGTVDMMPTTCGVGECVSTGVCVGGVDDCVPGDPSPEICDGLDNDCDDVIPVEELDSDGDGYMPCAGDCNDANGYTYPGAPEVNDGQDNQCVGDFGYGLIDELSGEVEHIDRNFICWEAQVGATVYEVLRSSDRTFESDCAFATVAATCFEDTERPGPGERFYYLVRPLAPLSGSWGAGLGGSERDPVCAAECAHSICVVGDRLDQGCSACVGQICAADAFCCNVMWDELCVEAVRTICNSLICAESAGSCSHTLCTEGPPLTPGCDSPPAATSCVDAICAVDSYCCSTFWDSICIGEVVSVCNMNCDGF